MSNQPSDHPDPGPDAQPVPYATPGEVEQALTALTPADRCRLLAWARTCLWGSSRYSRACPEELLSDAINGAWRSAKAISEGRRKEGRAWKPAKTSFVQFLMGTMRGMASDSRVSKEHTLRVQGPNPEPWDPEHPEVFWEAQQREQHEQAMVDELKKKDGVLKVIIEGLAAGMKPAAIQKAAHITPTEYESARRRLRRWAHKLGRERSNAS
jgi:hypothetical protein